MSAPIVTLATSSQFPNLDSDEAGLLDALYERGMEPRIAQWDDPSVDWENAGVGSFVRFETMRKIRRAFLSGHSLCLVSSILLRQWAGIWISTICGIWKSWGFL